jgi:hypothetical protein
MQPGDRRTRGPPARLSGEGFPDRFHSSRDPAHSEAIPVQKSPSGKFVLVQHSLGLMAGNGVVFTDTIRSRSPAVIPLSAATGLVTSGSQFLVSCF